MISVNFSRNSFNAFVPGLADIPSPDSDFVAKFISLLKKKMHLVKAMVFPVVMYGCESWTTKKAEHRRIDAFEL